MKIAELAGLNRTYMSQVDMSQVELGQVRLGIEVAEKLAHGLGLSLSVLVARVEERAGPSSWSR